MLSRLPWRYAEDDNACGAGNNCLLRRLTDCKLEEIPADNVLFQVRGVPPRAGGPPRSCTHPDKSGGITIERSCTLAEACLPEGSYNTSSGLCDCPEGFVSENRRCQEIGGSRQLRQNKELRSDRALLKRAHNRGRGFQPGYPIHGNGKWNWGFGKRSNLGGDANPIPNFKFSDFKKYLLPAVVNELMSSYTLLRMQNRPYEECIAVQIRRGDSCLDRPCFPVKDYMDNVKKMLSKYGGTPAVFCSHG